MNRHPMPRSGFLGLICQCLHDSHIEWMSTFLFAKTYQSERIIAEKPLPGK
jgi:hypothetical protein